MSQEKYQIVSRLLNDEEPKGIAASLDVPIGKVLRLKRELKEAMDNDALASFIDMNEVMMKEVLETVRAKSPEALCNDVDNALANISTAKTMLDSLSTDLQVTARFLANRIKSMAGSSQAPHELEILTTALCELQNSFFNKNSTQVNVQNNYGVGYGDLLSDAPIDN